MLIDLPVQQLLTLAHRDAHGAARNPIPDTRSPLFQLAHPPPYKQTEPAAPDFAFQPLLPDQPSRQGPPIAVGDVDGDGLEDVFIGGGVGIPGKLFLQQKNGRFIESTGEPWSADGRYEDWGAVFFDANGDGLPDLY